MKKFFTYPVLLIIFLFIVGSILFGSLLRHHYLGGTKYKFLQKQAIFLAEIPYNIKRLLKGSATGIPKLDKYKDKERFKQFISNKRNVLLVLPQYDHSMGSSRVEIIDLSNFEVIHTFKHDIIKMNRSIKNKKIYKHQTRDQNLKRFIYKHPLILRDGSLVSHRPLFKIDICSNLEWINDEEYYHHSITLDHEENIWAVATLDQQSVFLEQFKINSFKDNAIIKLNKEGKILFKKSVIEILVENKIFDLNIVNGQFLRRIKDPIHLNFIEPALNDTPYWNKGDLFLSIRNQSAIIHYRPTSNKIINYITGPFSQQHAPRIISEKEILIFNNNNFLIDNDHSEIMIYNFETEKFRKIFNEQLQKEDFKSRTNGISHILSDGALIVEETIHGRIILFNNKGEKEWEFISKDKNGNISKMNWFRIIEDELFIENFRSLTKNKECK